MALLRSRRSPAARPRRALRLAVAATALTLAAGPAAATAAPSTLTAGLGLRVGELIGVRANLGTGLLSGGPLLTAGADANLAGVATATLDAEADLTPAPGSTLLAVDADAQVGPLQVGANIGTSAPVAAPSVPLPSAPAPVAPPALTPSASPAPPRADEPSGRRPAAERPAESPAASAPVRERAPRSERPAPARPAATPDRAPVERVRRASGAPAATPAAAPVVATPAVAPETVTPAPAPARPQRETPGVTERVVDAAVDVGRSPWLLFGLLVGGVAYLLGQRMLDGGAKLSYAGRPGAPDDELIEL